MKNDTHCKNLNYFYTLSQQKILKLNDIIKLFSWVRDHDQDYIDIVDEIFFDSGYYLPRIIVNQIVRDDIDDKTVCIEIERQKGFFERSTFLLPEILNYLKYSKEDLFSVIMLIDDIHQDFDLISMSNRQDKEKRKITDTMKSCIDTTNILLKIIDQIHYTATNDYEYSFRATIKLESSSKKDDFQIGSLIKKLNLLSASVELTLKKIDFDKNFLDLTANQSKTFVVENVYRLAVMANGPRLVTTPGSNFSVLCGLIFELVSGKSDESLAGAINRFSRSERKKEIDLEEKEFKAESSVADNDTDNFCREKNQIRSAVSNLENLRILDNSTDLSNSARSLIKSLIKFENISIENAESRYGPNIIWAHQMPRGYSDKFEEEMGISKSQSQQVKDMEIELGRLRRALRSS